MTKKDEQGIVEEIIAELDIETIQLKNKRWLLKLSIKEELPQSFHEYKMVLNFDPSPYERRIEELERDLDGTLFKEDPEQRKIVDKKITEIRNQIEQHQRDCEETSFTAIVEKIEYKEGKTLVLLRVPDDVIEPFNRQKMRMTLYKVSLSPLY